MSPHFHNKVYNHFLVFFICVWLIYCNVHSASSEVNDTGIQCVKSERAALLRFKQGIRVDNCGLLNSWGDNLDCCHWHGIRCSNNFGHVIGLHLGIDNYSYYYNHKACLEGILSESLLELKHLKYLDLSLNYFNEQLPKFIGSLDALEHLNLSKVGFFGVIPQEIGNLSRLSSLDLSCRYDDSFMWVKNLRWLLHLRLLKQLDLSFVDLSAATNMWLPIVNNLPFLQVIRLDFCQLSLVLSSSLSYINSSSTLNVISLSDNNMNDTSIFKWLSKLKGLDTSLQSLDLSGNPMFGNNVEVSGDAVQLLGSLCNLQTLDLSETNLYYDFSRIVQSFSNCPHKAIASLDLRDNQVWGSIPDNINTLSSLRELYLVDNQLNGTISQALGGLSMLETLYLSYNSLEGVVTGEHLSNLSKLSQLFLGDNTELVFNISANWIPPFQLDYLSLRNCKVGPNLPTWLATQKHLRRMYLSNCGINSKIPISFFNSLSSKLEKLNMSHNMMYGVLPTFVSAALTVIDLSSNKFWGEIPKFMRNVTILNLSNNNFSQGLVPFLCAYSKTPLASLDLSYNSFSDKLPDCWENFDKLVYLHLENNKLWGNLPASIGELDQLNFLHLSNNNISGELPTSLVNCKSLAILDLSHNTLTGRIPSTFGYGFDNLGILTLQNNNFSGVLPSSLCRLFRVQILDFSNNLIHGPIPQCIYNLKAMADMGNVTAFQSDSIIAVSSNFVEESFDNALIMWKRKERYLVGEFSVSKTKAIDFSNNKLEGHIPEGLSSLLGLVSINLSRNHLSGAIPSKIGQLTSLEALDLSHNHLSGNIPTSLAKITTLEMLDFSYNNLSGRIPTGPQLQTLTSYSTYMGNPELCGDPLPKCPGDEAATTPHNEDKASPHDEHHLDDFMLGLYISVVLGLITGFWAVFGALALKRTWRHAFFQFYDDMKDKIYVVVVMRFARVWRRS